MRASADKAGKETMGQFQNKIIRGRVVYSVSTSPASFPCYYMTRTKKEKVEKDGKGGGRCKRKKKEEKEEGKGGGRRKMKKKKEKKKEKGEERKEEEGGGGGEGEEEGFAL